MKTFSLDELEYREFKRLPKEIGKAWDFWRRVGARSRIDFSDGQLLVLPRGNGVFAYKKIPLKCAHPAGHFGW